MVDVFFDHASGFLYVEHQVGFSAVETVSAKQNYESMCMGYGNVFNNYLNDNGVFKGWSFYETYNRTMRMLKKKCAQSLWTVMLENSTSIHLITPLNHFKMFGWMR